MGHDVLQKFGVIFKPVALTAFAVSTTDVMLYSHPKGYLQTLARYVHFGWPIFGAAAAFVLGHNLAGSIRNKDDKLNWVYRWGVRGRRLRSLEEDNSGRRVDGWRFGNFGSQ
jgi:hypothetical protein